MQTIMRPSTSDQAPNRALQSKRQKLTPTIDPNMLKPLSCFSDILIDMNSDDPSIRSHAVRQLTVLSPLMQQLTLAKKIAGVHYTARDFKSLGDACTILGITHDPMELWNRPDVDKSPSATLSPDVDSVIHRLQVSEYHTIDNSEASVRVVVELLILDRLHHLSDKGSLEHLQLYPEVDVNLLRGNNYITGRADWLLCHDEPQYGIDSALIAIEAKRSRELSSADSQIATYLAAIQDCRTKLPKIHAISFGITTDGTRYQFWFLDSERQLSSSVILDWRLDKAKIIAWIDKMLADAIEASPLTTPTLRRNVSLRNWEKDFRRRRLLSSESEDSPSIEGLPFDITVPESSQLIGHAWYQGRKVMVVEYDADEEPSDNEEEDEAV
ncbi:uncharacterized protein N7484_001887 [Penicillium longicatenatum]|uniref:uncharacterized protein n=1 Tax=Penicillium longicatenatum TaxID=1561947 RepID=UPI002548BDEE|nr:uncharacterized protein N7484_001887 [Penicillium longicatenatum]KAJ5658238.1 hypothetical protein N7484_001887 [Penicillium longicatenatum]